MCLGEDQSTVSVVLPFLLELTQQFRMSLQTHEMLRQFHRRSSTPVAQVLLSLTKKILRK